MGSPVGEETRRPPTSSRDSALRLPPPSYLQARNRAQASQTHQSVSLTNHAGAIGLVPHQGRAAWDELSAEEKEGGVSCLPGWHSDSPRPEGGRGVAGGGQEIPQPSCSSRVSRGWRLGHTPCRAPGLHPASPHTSYVTLGKVVFRVFYFFIFFNFCKSLFEPN